MARHSDARGRFDTVFEQESMFDGISSELQRTVGQQVDWLIFDEANSEKDAIYSVASDKEIGRKWKRKHRIDVFGAFIYQGASGHNNRGFYNTDTLLVSVSADQLIRTMPDVVTSPDKHILDRIAYRGQLFVPNTVRLLGLLHNHHTVISVESRQVNAEESVNDEQYTENKQPYHVIGSEDDVLTSDMTYIEPEA